MPRGNPAIKRLNKELKKVKKEPIDGIMCEPEGEDMFKWKGSIVGPKNTPYEGGTWVLKFEFPENFPFKPPKVSFVTKIYHCNVDPKGKICLDILKDNWAPSLSMQKILMSIML